jgi:hypothetical protein
VKARAAAVDEAAVDASPRQGLKIMTADENALDRAVVRGGMGDRASARGLKALGAVSGDSIRSLGE